MILWIFVGTLVLRSLYGVLYAGSARIKATAAIVLFPQRAALTRAVPVHHRDVVLDSTPSSARCYGSVRYPHLARTPCSTCRSPCCWRSLVAPCSDRTPPVVCREQDQCHADRVQHQLGRRYPRCRSSKSRTPRISTAILITLSAFRTRTNPLPAPLSCLLRASRRVRRDRTPPPHGSESTAIPARLLFCRLVSTSRSTTAWLPTMVSNRPFVLIERYADMRSSLVGMVPRRSV